MIINSSMKILIVGLGLLGGSYARALTKKGYSYSSIELCKSLGVELGFADKWMFIEKPLIDFMTA